MRRYNNIDKLALQRAIPQIVSYRKMNFATGADHGNWKDQFEKEFSEKSIDEEIKKLGKTEQAKLAYKCSKFNGSKLREMTYEQLRDAIIATFPGKWRTLNEPHLFGDNREEDQEEIRQRLQDVLGKICNRVNKANINYDWYARRLERNGGPSSQSTPAPEQDNQPVPSSTQNNDPVPESPAPAGQEPTDQSQSSDTQGQVVPGTEAPTSDKKKLNDLKKEFHEDMNKYLKRLKSDKNNEARAEFFKDLLLCFERTGDKKVGFTGSVNRVAQIGERIHPLPNDEKYYLKQQQNICDGQSAQGMADLAEFQCSVMKDITAAAQNIGDDLGDTKLKELVFKDDDGDTLKNLWNLIRKIDVNSKDAETQGFFEKHGTYLAIGGAIGLGGLALGKLVSHLREKARRRREARANRR